VGGQIGSIEGENGRVVGVWYTNNSGGIMSAAQVSAKMNSFGWSGGYRIEDNANHELWNAFDLWPSSPGVFVVRTSDMTVVASEASGQLNLPQEAANLNQ
jgi:hypothetical protein